MDYSKGELIEFKAPQGVVPEDVKAGDTFDLVSTYRLKGDGMICLVMIGDHKMPGYDEDEYDHDEAMEHRDGYKGYMSSMHEAMGTGGGGPGNTDQGGGY